MTPPTSSATTLAASSPALPTSASQRTTVSSVRQKGTTMAIASLGASIPRTIPMTDAQYRAHQNLARAERRLIHLTVWGGSPAKVAAAQQRVNKWTSAWRGACAAARLTGETVR